MMIKSSLIFGIIAFVLGAGFTLLSPICVPCVAIFLGLGAGAVAGFFDKPPNSNASVKTGALSGVFSGIGAILGQLVGAGVNAAIVGPQEAQQIMNQFGLTLPTSGNFGAGYYFGVFGSACCVGLFDVLIMAGLGAVGGLLWWQISGQRRAYNNNAIM
jgi:hypothetical protein